MDRNWPIERVRGSAQGRSSGSGFDRLAWAVATSDDTSVDVAEQARRSFAKIDRILGELGTDKRYLLSATVYLADLREKPDFDQQWLAWVGSEERHWPQRACVQAALAGGARVEIAVVAAKP